MQAKFAQFDISEIRSEYDEKEHAKNQITDDFLIKLLQQMIWNFFPSSHFQERNNCQNLLY